MINRRRSREAVFGLLYELEFHEKGESLDEIYRTALTEREIEENSYIQETFYGVVDKIAEIDREIREHSEGWKPERISKVPMAIMRLSVYEMVFSKEKLPYSIAINEALELTKAYAEDNAPAFVNGILNAVAKANNCEA